MFEEIELDINRAKALVAKGDALTRLRNNQDFRDGTLAKGNNPSVPFDVGLIVCPRITLPKLGSIN